MKKLILILFLVSPVEAQSFKFLPMKHDAPNTQQGDFFKYDKLDHFTAHALLTMAIPTKKYNLDLWCSIFAGLIYELNDARPVNVDVTMGFSRTDFIFDIAGAIFGVFLKDLFHSIGVYVLIERNRISLNF